jgi:hypothetical protein
MIPVSLLLALLAFAGLAGANDALPVVPGVITAGNVDITADDGSLLAERLGVGDNVFIVVKPKSPRKGWVRISRSPEDTLGIGWVEAKNIQRFKSYQSAGAASAKPAAVIEPKRGQARIAVLPFGAQAPGDPFARALTGGFADALKAQGRFEVLFDLPAAGVNPESPEEVRRFLISHQLDGIFAGKMSNVIGGNRLVQVRYLGRDANAFSFEKMKRVPVAGDSRKAMKELADLCATTLSSL